MGGESGSCNINDQINVNRLELSLSSQSVMGNFFFVMAVNENLTAQSAVWGGF